MPDTPRLLVPFDGSAAAEHLLRYACRVALRDYDRLMVLCVAALPPDLPADASPPDTAAGAMHALAVAQHVCREEGVVAIFRLTYAHDLARAILAEAERDGAALICLSLDAHAPGETALMSPAVQSVLASAPVAVLLTDPAAELPPGKALAGNDADRPAPALGR
jgi:nucleotide-binding universal stress UspA family protein